MLLIKSSKKRGSNVPDFERQATQDARSLESIDSERLLVHNRGGSGESLCQ